MVNYFVNPDVFYELPNNENMPTGYILYDDMEPYEGILG